MRGFEEFDRVEFSNMTAHFMIQPVQSYLLVIENKQRSKLKLKLCVVKLR